jgi:Zn-dependent peptidase ImmA (M78 family)
MEDICRAQARRLLSDLKIDEPPIALEQVARGCGLEVEYVHKPKGFFGQLIRERRLIEVQDDVHPNRQRFTLAHEIGHYVLGHDPTWSVFDSRSIENPKRVNEKQADIFASELLMSEPQLRKQWTELNKDYKLMARKFGVSEEAMFLRLQDAKLIVL